MLLITSPPATLPLRRGRRGLVVAFAGSSPPGSAPREWSRWAGPQPRGLDAAFHPGPRQAADLTPNARKDPESPLKHSTNWRTAWVAGGEQLETLSWLARVRDRVRLHRQRGRTKYLEDSDLAVGEAATANKIIESGFTMLRTSKAEMSDQSRQYRGTIQRSRPRSWTSRRRSRVTQVSTLDTRSRPSRRPRLGRRSLGDGAVQPKGARK